jgi:hypothetical protein
MKKSNEAALFEFNSQACSLIRNYQQQYGVLLHIISVEIRSSRVQSYSSPPRVVQDVVLCYQDLVPAARPAAATLHLQWTSLSLMMGPTCPEMSVKDYHSTLPNTPQERRSHQHRGGSLKSWTMIFSSSTLK